jgi:GT2 family glycosyltransferase
MGAILERNSDQHRVGGTVTVALLTYKRNHLLQRQLEALSPWRARLADVVVVDNAGEPPAEDVCRQFPWARLVRAPSNLGAAGRNLGFEAAHSTFIVTLDDDVVDFRPEHIGEIERAFQDPDVACVNFRVIEEGTGRLVNWVHHRDPRLFAQKEFDTYEISEGACAFRLSCLVSVGGYPESFFLSHEGPDLAYRLMNRGWRVIYCPRVTVTHLFAIEGRQGWRRYYYDTRNTLWLAARNLPVIYGLRLVLRQTVAMAFYSARDGYILVWFRALWHGLLGLQDALRARQKLTPAAMRRVREIDRFRPGVLQLAWLRLRSPTLRMRGD